MNAVPRSGPAGAPAPAILVVDDDESLLTLITLRLEASGFRVLTARNATEALGIMAAQRPQLAIVDLRLEPDNVAQSIDVNEADSVDGLVLFRRMRQLEPLLPVMILTAHGSIPDAVEATREGVAAFLSKPFDGRTLVDEVKRLLALHGAPFSVDADWRKGIVTRNRAMLALVDEIARVAPTDATVMVTGPSGSGKELIARALHAASPRHLAPFVAINCAALPEQLLESELFGHVKGSFSGAAQDHQGLFRSGNGGTMLLDEIGDMPLALQSKLLRVLQERRVRPVGGTKEVDTDVRVVAATHRDLAELIRAGTFREDLFYRLNVVRLALPPLDERRDDIPLLARHFADRIGRKYGKEIRAFAPDAVEVLLAAPWPGHVRQLQNVVEQCVVLADGPVIGRALAERALRTSPAGDALPSGLPSLAEARDQFERDYLTQVLKLTGGNIAQGARIARRNRTEFYRLLQKHGLHRELFR
ncbi:MAG TPA: sigma 54-interacting transcriptional regulator [Burkholderiaceae bacterium]|jgi:two-component system response regulator GlrR|nr:sigma 54-interacting transcriptional regulator [Burkholderiaceae bacterium]